MPPPRKKAKTPQTRKKAKADFSRSSLYWTNDLHKKRAAGDDPAARFAFRTNPNQQIIHS
jgi:hypothetical protein